MSVLKTYIVCVPEKWDERQVALPFSVKAESHLAAARAVFTSHPNLAQYANGDITVLEAKAGRLDPFRKFYSVEKILG